MTTKHSQLYEQAIAIDEIRKKIGKHLDWCERQERNAAIENDEDYRNLLKAEDLLNIAYCRLVDAADAIDRADQYFAFPL